MDQLSIVIQERRGIDVLRGDIHRRRVRRQRFPRRAGGNAAASNIVTLPLVMVLIRQCSIVRAIMAALEG